MTTPTPVRETPNTPPARDRVGGISKVRGVKDFPNVLPARFAGGRAEPPRRQIEAALIVSDAGADVLVRYRLGHPWRCEACGPQVYANGCHHVFAAALVLAQTYLGLDRLPELEPAVT